MILAHNVGYCQSGKWKVQFWKNLT